MEQMEYIQNQILAVNEAIRLAKKAMKTTEDLQEFFDPSKDSEAVTAQEDFSRDMFKYFDASSALRQMEGLQFQLGKLKEQLIKIKIDNDRLLYAGGYLHFIDEAISRIFLKNTLCKLLAQNESTPVIIEDTIGQLKALKAKMEEYAAGLQA